MPQRKKEGMEYQYVLLILKAKLTLTVANTDIEALAVIFNERSRKISLSGVYEPPQGKRMNSEMTLDEIGTTMLKIGISLIDGDFNMDVSSSDTISFL